MIRLLTFLLHHVQWFCGIYVLGLALVSLWPRYAAPPTPSQQEKSSGLFPQEGDNFKIVDASVVYRLDRGHRRPYKSAAAFLSRSENPPFGTPYVEGGILLCDSIVLLFYPLGVKMPRPNEGKIVPFHKRPLQRVNAGRSLLRKDKVGHLLVYMGLAILLWLAFFARSNRSTRQLFWMVLLVGSGLGFLLEMGQQFFSEGRDAEWEDMLMNVLGLVLGAVLCARLAGLGAFLERGE